MDESDDGEELKSVSGGGRDAHLYDYQLEARSRGSLLMLALKPLTRHLGSREC